MPVEVVTVGDCPLDDRLESMVRAAREAMVNAAKFSGVDHVDVFVEVEPDEVTVFVRDTGVGFDPAAVPDDRRGVAESIVGRMDRHGGTATVRSAPGEGTEVELTMARVTS
jgi:signal transduction histidine kinase